MIYSQEKGIYTIINKINNKQYIGSTSESFERRTHHHLCLLRSGKHKNRHLQHAWDLYGENNFEFLILEVCEMNFLRRFESSMDLQDWSLTEENDLPIKSRFGVQRMGEPVKFLQNVNIRKAAKTGKPYKGLHFKLITKSPSHQ